MKKEALTYRPIELVHDFKFIPCCFAQDVELPSPKERLDRLKALGYGGVAICPSYTDYLSDESLQLTREIIKYAKEIGLSVWIYDEKYYPSGGADGTVARENPRYEAKALAVVIGEPDEKGVIYINSPHGYGSVKYAYAIELDEDGSPRFESAYDVMDHTTFGGGILLDTKKEKATRVYAFFGKNAFEFATTSHNTRGVRRYIDTLMPDATRSFLEKTFGGYDALGDLSEYVEAVFTDEPQIPALCRMNYLENYREEVLKTQNSVFVVRDIPDSGVAFTPYLPWTEGFENAFISRHGYDIIPLLPRLFFDEGDAGNEVRRDFWDTASMLFEKSFGGVYSDFAVKNGVAYTGHLLYEEEFELHPYMHGDSICQLGAMDIPGCDMLFASPTQILDHAAAIKLAASAAQLYGKNDMMIEASNIMKDVFPITEEALKLATSMEAALGATRFLSYYTETAMAGENISRCCDFTERLLKSLSDTMPARNVFIYIPNGEIWEQTYPTVAVSDKKPPSEKLSSIKTFLRSVAGILTGRGIDFCYINDERLSTLLDSKAFDNAVIVVPPMAKIPTGAEKFSKVIDGLSANEVADELSRLGYKNVVVKDDVKLVTLKKVSEKKDAFLLVNYGESFDTEVMLNTKKPLNRASIYDPDTGDSTDAELTNGGLRLFIPSGECRVIFVNNS